MQQFDDNKGERRLINIANMKEEEVKDFYNQYYQYTKEQKKDYEQKLAKQIRKLQTKKPSKWILAVHSKEGKLVGKIEVKPLEETQIASFQIQIPNENWVRKYGLEAIDQFLKICKENKYFQEIRIMPEPITEQYKNMHNMKNYIVQVA